MSPDSSRPRRRVRLAVAAGALGLVTAVTALASVAPATAAPGSGSPSPVAPGSSLSVVLAKGTVLTLPAHDGLRDRATAQVRSGSPGRVTVDAVRGRTTVHLATAVPLEASSTDWSRAVTIPVAKLSRGTWRIRAERTTDHAVSARSRTFAVGSGAAVHVAVRPAERTLYPYRDGLLDTAAITVVAKDETGAVVPVTGSIRIDAGRAHVTRSLGRAGAAVLPITSLPLGPAVVHATVTGPTGPKAVRTTTITLAPTGVGRLAVTRSSGTVEPVVDGRLDSVVLTTTGTASAGSPARVSGTLTVAKGRTVAARWSVRDGRKRSFTWNGRVGGRIVPGTYRATLTLKGPQGAARTTSTTLRVSTSHLPYTVRNLITVAAGNQQGLAIRDGHFVVGYDIGNGQTRLDVYDRTGTRTASLGPLPIPHMAELAYSATTGMLYAATGGATTSSKVVVIDPLDPQWTAQPQTDPSAAIRATYDYSSTLGDNAMVAVDDAAGRLLVFSGATGHYAVSTVALTDGPVPAGTIISTTPIAITGVPQGIDLVGGQLWIYTSIPGRRINHIEKYDPTTDALLPAAATPSADLYWGGEGEGMATVADSAAGEGLPAGVYLGAHDPNRSKPNHIGVLVPVTAR